MDTPILLLHGSDGDRHDWDLFLKSAPDPTRFHAPDRPGHGDAPKLPGDPFPSQVSFFLHRLKPNTTIVAHSWAGALALELARQAPDRVARLVLLAPWTEPRVDPPPFSLRIARGLGGRFAFTLLHAPGVKRVLVRRFVGGAFWPDPVPQGYLEHALQNWQDTPTKVAEFTAENLGLAARLPALKRLHPEIQVPTVVLAGELDKALHARRHAEALARELPNVEVRGLAGEGHMIAQTRPASVLRAIAGESEDPDAERLATRFGWNPVTAQTTGEGFLRWHGPDAFVAYASRVHVRVAAGPPVCDESRLAEIATAFEADSRRVGRRVVWFAATDRLRLALTDHAALSIGATPWWNPQDWKPHRSLRGQINRARNKGLSVTEGASAEEMTALLSGWLGSRRFPALGFLTRAPDPRRIGDRRVFAARVEGRLVAYALAAPVPLRNGWLVEAIVRGEDAPNGASEALVAALSETFCAEGATYATLGLAPLSTRGEPVSGRNPLAERLVTLGRERTAGLYDFPGLEEFKAKFRPVESSGDAGGGWEPAYLLSPRRRVSPLDLLAVMRAFTDEPLPAILRRYLEARRAERADGGG